MVLLRRMTQCPRPPLDGCRTQKTLNFWPDEEAFACGQSQEDLGLFVQVARAFLSGGKKIEQLIGLKSNVHISPPGDLRVSETAMVMLTDSFHLSAQKQRSCNITLFSCFSYLSLETNGSDKRNTMMEWCHLGGGFQTRGSLWGRGIPCEFGKGGGFCIKCLREGDITASSSLFVTYGRCLAPFVDTRPNSTRARTRSHRMTVVKLVCTGEEQRRPHWPWLSLYLSLMRARVHARTRRVDFSHN